MNLANILKDSNYKLSQFTAAEIEQLEQSITLKTTKSGEFPYTVCLVRQKAIKLTPEEAIRQLYLQYFSTRFSQFTDSNLAKTAATKDCGQNKITFFTEAKI